MTDTITITPSATPAASLVSTVTSALATGNPITDIISEIGQTVRQILPDPQAAAQVTLQLAQLQATIEQQQNSVNQVEASNPNLFVSGWRPAVGWVCAATLAWTWIIAPLVNWIATLYGYHLTVPALNPEECYPIVLGMLGMGGLHSFDRYNGTATNLTGQTLTPQVTPATTQPVKRKGLFNW